MKYMGSKARLSKYILPIITEHLEIGMTYVEPFVGGCNMIDKIRSEHRIGCDINSYLIEMWIHLRDGWIPPQQIPRDEYNLVRSDYNTKARKYLPHYIGYIGFSGSYGGRFFEGGYAGITNTKGGERNYPLEAYNNIMKQIPMVQNIDFKCCSYDELELTDKCVIYCDPPYHGTKEYAKSGFDSDKFWQWCRNKSDDGHIIFVSEYAAPEDFTCVWEKETTSSLRANSVISGAKKSVERLFTVTV